MSEVRTPAYPEHWGHWMGTAAHPPIEWVLSKQIEDLTEIVQALAARFEELER